MLVHEHRHKPGKHCGFDIVEQALSQALDDQQIALVERARQDRAGVGERPSVDVAPVLEDPHDPVEVARDRLATAAHPLAELVDLAADPLGLCSGLQSVSQIGVGFDGVVEDRQLAVVAGGAALVRQHLGALQAQGHLALVVVAVGGELGRKLNLADRSRWIVEVGLCELDRVAARRDPADPHSALAMCGGEHRDTPRVPALFDVDDVAGAQLHQRQVDQGVPTIRRCA